MWNPGATPDQLAVCLSSGHFILIKVQQSAAQVVAVQDIGATCCM